MKKIKQYLKEQGFELVKDEMSLLFCKDNFMEVSIIEYTNLGYFVNATSEEIINEKAFSFWCYSFQDFKKKFNLLIK